jgi:hypothetical protein
MLIVYDGTACLGFILNRGPHGFEAVCRDEKTLGTYATQREAADAVSAAAKP